jgi:hypothetical protein
MSTPEFTTAAGTPRNQRASRRRSPKSSTRARATRNPLGLGPNIAVSVLDISEGGVRLLLKEDLRPGQEFEVNLESDARRSVKMVARVIWSVATNDGRYCVGSCFLKPLGYADLQGLARP